MREGGATARPAFATGVSAAASFRTAFTRCLPLSDLPALEALQSSVTADAQAALSEADRIAQSPRKPLPPPDSGEWLGDDGRLHTGPQPKRPQGPAVYQAGLVLSLRH